MIYREQMSDKHVTLSMRRSGTPAADTFPDGRTAGHAHPGRKTVSGAVPLPAFPSDIQQHIGNLLRASYNEVLTEPIPDRFLQLLDELESASAENPDKKGNPRDEAGS